MIAIEGSTVSVLVMMSARSCLQFTLTKMCSVRYPASQNQPLHPIIHLRFFKGTLLLPSLTDISLDSHRSSLYLEDELAGFPELLPTAVCLTEKLT